MDLVYIEEEAYKKIIAKDKIPLVKLNDPKTRKKFKNGPCYYIFGYFIYVLILMPFAYAVTYIDDIDTHNQYYEDFYDRTTYYSIYFSPAKFIYWLLLAIIGFTFVVVVNLDNKRSDPFMSRDGSHKDIKKLIPVAFVLYFCSSLVFLRGRHDMQRGCLKTYDPNNAQDSTIISVHENQFNTSYLIEPAINISNAEIIQNELNQAWEDFSGLFIWNDIKISKCYVYSKFEMFVYNYAYLLVYFIGLNFTHLDNPPFNQFTLEWDVMKNWPWYLWAVFVMLCLFLLSNIAYLLRLYYASEVLPQYLLLVAAIPTFFIVVTKYYGDRRKLHIHHYVIGFVVVMLAGYQNYYVSSLGGIFMGIMVEGAARWGFDPIWIPK